MLNAGSISTCVRWQAESIVDVTFTSPAAMKLVAGWRWRGVETDIESASNYLYISMEIRIAPQDVLERRWRNESTRTRWFLNKLDEDALMATW